MWEIRQSRGSACLNSAPRTPASLAWQGQREDHKECRTVRGPGFWGHQCSPEGEQVSVWSKTSLRKAGYTQSSSGPSLQTFSEP